MSEIAKEPSNNKNTAIYIGVALLLAGRVLFKKLASNSSKTDDDSLNDVTGDKTNSPIPIAVYVTKMLKIGSKGIEVTKLQTLMKISADGFFGTQTESMLFRLKGVKEVSLDQYAKLPTINRNIIPNGSKVMASNKNGANIYGAIKKVDGTYYSSGKINKTIPFGQAVGVIRSQSADGNSYTIFYNDLQSWSSGNAAIIGFVNAIDIEKYN